MPTNDEIKQKLKRENPARVWELDEPALTNALDEARADTAKQIFKELDTIRIPNACEYCMDDAVLKDDDVYIALKKEFNIEE